MGAQPGQRSGTPAQAADRDAQKQELEERGYCLVEGALSR
jgi:hypothetical protein